MRKLICIISILLSTLTAQAQISLCGQWDFQLNNGKWSKILVPGNWELQGFDTPKYGRDLVKSTAIYRRNFQVPANWSNQLIRITFEGVNYGFSFSINGKEVGNFHSSYNQRVFDITPWVKVGEDNLIEVRVETQPRAYLFDVNDDWSLSGISRPVHIDAVPKTHIEDATIRTSLQGSDARVGVKVKVEKASQKERVIVEGDILDASHRKVCSLVGDWKKDSCLNVLMKSPHLWTAETPYLYTLQLRIRSGKKVVHTYNEKFGVREVTWANQVFCINGKPVKLRGINHHDLSPVKGRAISDAEMLQDMKLMKAANINTIRMSHYPPAKRLLELCDSMGMYVIDEVPYGFGDEWLGKREYLKDLKERAYYTLLRDKNHPSVVIWSVGNENPITPIGLETGRYVYRMDNTRPYVFPQTHKPFAKMLANDYDSITMYSAHYPAPTELRQWAKITKHPIINTEYAHALGLDFGMMQDCVEKWYQNPQLAGGCVWELFDQGLLRKSEKPISKDDYTEYAWLDANTYYDTDGNHGADGIVYANRFPQVDYWQVRKVYAPVKMSLRSYKNGKLLVRFINHYDFVNLSDVNVHWSLYSNQKKVKAGDLTLNCAPHDTVCVELKDMRTLPQQVSYVTMTVTDSKGQALTEQTFRLDQQDNLTVWNRLNQKSSVDLWNRQNLLAWVRNNVYARVGKKMTMSEQYVESKEKKLWSKRIIPCTKASIASASGDSLMVECLFVCDSTHHVGGHITFRRAIDGGIQVHYRLKAEGKGVATETGLSFLMPDAKSVRWMGNGPYAAYPSKSQLSEFGFWQLNTDDIYFPGNRQSVSVMMLSDANGKGWVVIPEDKAKNMALERYPQGIIVSHNAMVARPYNKFTRPKYINLDDTVVEGRFNLVAIDGNWSQQLQELFGKPVKQVNSIAPFYHSYDQ